MKNPFNRMAHSQTRQPDPAPPAPKQPVQTPATPPPEAEPHKPPCPSCGKRKSRINGTKGSTRNRVCLCCGRAFTTFEAVKK